MPAPLQLLHNPLRHLKYRAFQLRAIDTAKLSLEQKLKQSRMFRYPDTALFSFFLHPKLLIYEGKLHIRTPNVNERSFGYAAPERSFGYAAPERSFGYAAPERVSATLNYRRRATTVEGWSLSVVEGLRYILLSPRLSSVPSVIKINGDTRHHGSVRLHASDFIAHC
jgi:hypothetical protein